MKNGDATTRAVFFDVDFTLISPGITFQGEGYQAFCARHGMDVDPARFEEAVASAASILDETEDAAYHVDVFTRYTSRIIEQMGGAGPTVEACAREIYAEWAACQHFDLYEDVPDVLRHLTREGIRVGLISNSHRCLASFQAHFELDGLISASVSSSEHGFMKPHPSIFLTALQLVDVPARDAVMVGDNAQQDVEGALRAGMRAVLLHRSGVASAVTDDLRARGVPVIRTLTELPPLL